MTRVRFVVSVIAEVDETLTVQEAIDRARGALFHYELGKIVEAQDHSVRVTGVESVRLEGEVEDFVIPMAGEE